MAALGRRYARALFEAARERGALEGVAASCLRLARLLEEPGLLARLLHPRTTAREKRALLGQALDEPGEEPDRLLAGLLEVVLRRRREALLPEILEEFRKLELRARGVLQGVVETARRLPADELQRLAVRLAASLGATAVLLEQRPRPELLAGLRVHVAGRILESTASGRLQELRARLLAAPLGTHYGDV